MTIYISSLADMPRLVQRLGIRDLVSIIHPDAQPPTLPKIAPARHYRCAVHDIVKSGPGDVLAEKSHIPDWKRCSTVPIDTLESPAHGVVPGDTRRQGSIG